MPVQHYNPVLSGMSNAYGLADRLRQYALDKQRVEFELAREQRIQQEEQRVSAQRDLATRLSLATNPALTEVGDASTRTIQGQIQDPQLARAYGAPEVAIAGVPTEGAIEHAGRRYAVKTPAEQLQERLQEAAIVSQAGNVSAADRARRVFESTAVPLPAELAARVGLAPGTMVSSTAVDDLLRAAASGEPRATPEAAPHYTTDDEGNVHAITRTGEVRNLGKLGKATREPAPARAASGELTPYQRAQQERQARQDAEAGENRKRGELQRLEADEARLQPEVVQLRQAASGYDAEGNKLKPGLVALAKSQLKAKEDRLAQIRKRKVELGFTTPEEARLAGAPVETAAKPTVESMSAKYGLR